MKLSEKGKPRKFRKGKPLILEGDPGDAFFVILSGRVKVFSIDEDGREVVYGLLGPGDFVGEMSLDGGPRSASVVAIEPTECSVLTLAQVKEHILEDPSFALELLMTAIRRAREATELLRSMVQDSAYQRLRAFLMRAPCREEGQERHLVERFTQQEIGARIGCGREMVSRLLKGLQQGGYVRVNRQAIVIVSELPRRW